MFNDISYEIKRLLEGLDYTEWIKVSLIFLSYVFVSSLISYCNQGIIQSSEGLGNLEELFFTVVS